MCALFIRVYNYKIRVKRTQKQRQQQHYQTIGTIYLTLLNALQTMAHRKIQNNINSTLFLTLIKFSLPWLYLMQIKCRLIHPAKPELLNWKWRRGENCAHSILRWMEHWHNWIKVQLKQKKRKKNLNEKNERNEERKSWSKAIIIMKFNFGCNSLLAYNLRIIFVVQTRSQEAKNVKRNAFFLVFSVVCHFHVNFRCWRVTLLWFIVVSCVPVHTVS